MNASTESVFEKWFAGSTGDPPVPPGDSPDGPGATGQWGQSFRDVARQFRSAGRRPGRARRPRHPFSKQALRIWRRLVRLESSHAGLRVPKKALVCVFFFNDTATTEIYTLSLHDALPI